jgi:hypothetical protein
LIGKNDLQSIFFTRHLSQLALEPDTFQLNQILQFVGSLISIGLSLIRIGFFKPAIFENGWRQSSIKHLNSKIHVALLFNIPASLSVHIKDLSNLNNHDSMRFDGENLCAVNDVQLFQISGTLSLARLSSSSKSLSQRRQPVPRRLTMLLIVQACTMSSMMVSIFHYHSVRPILIIRVSWLAVFSLRESA